MVSTSMPVLLGAPLDTHTHTHALARLGTATRLALAKEMCTEVTHVTPK